MFILVHTTYLPHEKGSYAKHTQLSKQFNIGVILMQTNNKDLLLQVEHTDNNDFNNNSQIKSQYQKLFGTLLLY